LLSDRWHDESGRDAERANERRLCKLRVRQVRTVTKQVKRVNWLSSQPLGSERPRYDDVSEQVAVLNSQATSILAEPNLQCASVASGRQTKASTQLLQLGNSDDCEPLGPRSRCERRRNRLRAAWLCEQIVRKQRRELRSAGRLAARVAHSAHQVDDRANNARQQRSELLGPPTVAGALQ
jgi:hypothetical protein